MKLIYSTQVSFSNIISKHINAFVLSEHEFKHLVALEFRLLHSSIFKNGRFHFLFYVGCEGEVESSPCRLS